MAYVIPAPVQPSVAVQRSAPNSNARYPVGRIFCVGRNYADHAREMGHDPNREPPFFFMKPASALVDARPELNASIAYPSKTSDLHHEIELVVAIGVGGSNITTADALKHVWGYAIGLDMTRRDLQGEAKKAQRPWEMGKAFDQSAPIGVLVPASDIGHPTAGSIELRVNGQVKQSGNLSQQIWAVDETIAALSEYVALQPGDLIFTGTPAGVGPCVRGDILDGVIEGVSQLRVSYR
jgi:fumarylpyruvate hydrolase